MIEEVEKIKTEILCDQDCNNCPLINHENSRLLTHIFNKLSEKYGNGVYLTIQSHCPNMTVCKDCRIDDFTHYEDCDLVKDCEVCK